MIARGEHIVIRKPNKKKATENGILLPDMFDQTYAYGRVVSVGHQVAEELGAPLDEGDIVVYDSQGVRDLQLDAIKDADVCVGHACHVFATISEKELEARKLPIP